MNDINDCIILNVLNDDNTSLFDKDYKFVIPIYQRAYSWSENDIEKLIDGILNSKDTYNLGIIVVYKNKNKYEVIDGQQRLTTLYMILKLLKKVDNNIEFSHRKKSFDTLKNIKSIIEKTDEKSNKYDQNLIEKVKIIQKMIKNENELIEKLKNTNVIITEIPNKMDKIHYFEIMNTRGKQLEKSDIVKAKMMSLIKDDEISKKIFSEIWEACSNINSHIHSNFKQEISNRLFGKDNNKFIAKDSSELFKFLRRYKSDFQPKEYSIEEIIDMNYIEDVNIEENVDNIYILSEKTEFESIITFPIFLLHTLHVFTEIYKYENKDILDEQIDENKLLEQYEKLFKLGLNEDDALDFIYCMLKTRFLFDQYIIRRKTDSKKLTKIDRKNLLLQSALRVSYTSPKTMHWITDSLIYLYKNKKNNINDFSDKLEMIIKDNIRELIDPNNKKEEITKEDSYFNKGTEINHIVFNYLDYLLWKKEKEKYKSYSFEFRNSVEHFYPQNPKGSKMKNVNYFGNLCLVNKPFNSELSNKLPSEKKPFIETKENNSIKLRLMIEYIKDKNSNEAWRESNYKDHGEEMLNLLLENINRKER